MLAVATVAFTLDGLDPALFRYVVVFCAGLALGGITVWALCARELRESREAVQRLDDILTAAREARAAAKGPK
jgi:hypothetical protein